MSLEVIRRIMESPGCAKKAAWALLVAMANRADDDGTGIYESMGNLAKTCGISRSTAFKYLPELTKTGLVVDTGEKHDCGHGFQTVIYRIDTSKLTQSADETESVVETSPQERLSPQNGSPPSALRTQTSPKPVQIDREIDGQPTQSQVATQSKTATRLNLVPVPYIPADSLTSREPETEKLVELFLHYQGNPGYNEKKTLLYWHSVLSRLLKTYPSLPAYMKFAFEADPFWSSGKLIRGKNSKGKHGKKYPDPLDYFEDMLEHIVTSFNRWEKAADAAARRKPSGQKAAKPPFKPALVAEEDTPHDRLRLYHMSPLEDARAYFQHHREYYETQHPDWLACFRERGICK